MVRLLHLKSVYSSQLITYLLIFLIVAVDFLFKRYSLSSLIYVKNPGLIMGHLSHAPALIRSIYVNGIGILLVGTFILVTFYLRFQSTRVLLGWSFFFGGVLGNFIDRIIYGYVIDYIIVGTFPAFNFADIIQLIGFVLILSGLKKELDKIIPIDNRRKFFNGPKAFHAKFVLKLVPLFLSISFIIFLFSFYFIKISVVEFGLLAGIDIEEFLKGYMFMSLSFLCLLSVFTSMLVMTLMNRIFGSVYAIEKYIDDTLRGKVYPLQLREKDYFKSLEAKLTEINNRCNDEI
jgi:signal peptidase II